jgi:hypothetical protein
LLLFLSFIPHFFAVIFWSPPSLTIKVISVTKVAFILRNCWVTWSSDSLFRDSIISRDRLCGLVVRVSGY